MVVAVVGWLTATPSPARAEWPWPREVHVPTASALVAAEQQWLAQVQAGAARRPASPPLPAEMFVHPPRPPQVEIDDCCITRLRPRAVDVGHPDYPKLLMRLANHFIEKREYFETQREAIGEAIVEADERGNSTKAAALRAKQAKFEEQSREASEQAVKLLKALTTTPTMARSAEIPEALLLSALETARLGKVIEMRDVALRLAQEFPDSRHVVGALLVLAEHELGRGATVTAAALYDRALTIAKGATRAYALVQRARCELQGRATPKAIERLTAAIEATSAAMTTEAAFAERLRRLRDAAREELVRAVAASGSPPGRAWPLLQRAGAGATAAEQVAPELLARLAEVYFETGSYAASTAAYEQLAALFPDDRRRCGWQERVVANSLASADRAAQWREVDRLAGRWEALKMGSEKQQIKRTCRYAAVTAMRGLALALHREAAGPPAPDPVSP